MVYERGARRRMKILIKEYLNTLKHEYLHFLNIFVIVAQLMLVVFTSEGRELFVTRVQILNKD